MTLRLVVVVAALVVTAACAPLPLVVVNIHVPRNGLCRDGLPLRVLIDAGCPDGVCGFTCAPGRWLQEP